MKKKWPLHTKILIGLLLGVVWAVIASFFGWSQFTLDWIDPFGTIFINLLKLIAVPLVLFSIISGIGGLGSPETLGRLGLKTLAFYLGTTIVAVTVGLLLVNVIKPGNVLAESSLQENRIAYELWARDQGIQVLDENCLSCQDAFADKVKNVKSRGDFSENPMKEKIDIADAKERRPLSFLVDMVPENIFFALNDNSLMLQVIIFGLFFGISLLFLPQDKGKPVMQLIDAMAAVFIKMVELVMRVSPFLVFALMAGVVARMAGDDPSQVLEIFKGLSVYALVVILGLFVLGGLIYPLLVKVFVKKLGFKAFLKHISPAQLLAFSTSSSAATLPVTLDCVENNVGVDKKISSFVLPIGATVNMDGTSLYQGVAVVFLAQLHLVDLSLAQQLMIVLTAVLASIGSAAVPSAGIVMLFIVMEAVQLNPAWIALILPIDRILDMCRTVVNVTGDATVATIIAESEGMLRRDVETRDLETRDGEIRDERRG